MKVEAITRTLPLKMVKQFIIALVVVIFLLFSFSLFISFNKEKSEQDDEDDLGYLENIVNEKGGCEE